MYDPFSGYDQWKTTDPDMDREEDWGAELRPALIALNEGRNLRCFPLGSFSWKDADLDPTGCSGIKSIDCPDEDTVIITIGLHGTIVPNEEWFDDDPRMQELQEVVNGCGLSGDWSGDDWCLHWEDTFRVRVVVDEDVYNPQATAELIYGEAKKRIGADGGPESELKLVHDFYPK